MPRRKLTLLFSLILAGAGGWCFAAETNNEPESAASNLPALIQKVDLWAWAEPGEFIGDVQLRRFYVCADTNRFGFMLSPGLIMHVPSSDKVTLTSPQYEYFLTLQIIAPGLFVYTDAVGRAIVDQSFPDAIKLEESRITALNHQGSLFKLRWKSPENVNRTVMAAFVPTPAGVMEVILVANPAKANEGADVIMDLLQRGRSNENGQLNMPIYRPLGYN